MSKKSSRSRLPGAPPRESHSAPKFKKQLPPRNWGRKVLIILIILLGGFWAWLKLSNPHTFPVRRVKIIDNANQIDHTLLQDTISPYIKNGMLWLNLPKLEDALEQLPWIEQATLVRKYPDQLLIQIIEKRPIAQWNNTAFLDNTGNIFTPEPQNSKISLSETDFKKLPALYGPKDMQNIVWQAYQQINRTLLPLNLSVSSLTMNNRKDCEVYLNNGLHLILGKNDVLNRLIQFAAAYPQLFQPNIDNIDYIDLRYSDGFAVRWKNNKTNKNNQNSL